MWTTPSGATEEITPNLRGGPSHYPNSCQMWRGKCVALLQKITNYNSLKFAIYTRRRILNEVIFVTQRVLEPRTTWITSRINKSNQYTQLLRRSPLYSGGEVV